MVAGDRQSFHFSSQFSNHNGNTLIHQLLEFSYVHFHIAVSQIQGL